MTLSDYNIQNESTLHLVLRLSSGLLLPAPPLTKFVTVEVVDQKAIDSVFRSGLPAGQSFMLGHLSASRTVLNDINGHLFQLRAGGNTPDDEDAANLFIPGEGDGDFSKIPQVTRNVPRSHAWEVKTVSIRSSRRQEAELNSEPKMMVADEVTRH